MISRKLIAVALMLGTGSLAYSVNVTLVNRTGNPVIVTTATGGPMAKPSKTISLGNNESTAVTFVHSDEFAKLTTTISGMPYAAFLRYANRGQDILYALSAHPSDYGTSYRTHIDSNRTLALKVAPGIEDFDGNGTSIALTPVVASAPILSKGGRFSFAGQ